MQLVQRSRADAQRGGTGRGGTCRRSSAKPSGCCRDRTSRGRSSRRSALQRGQVTLSFESVTERLKRLEAEIADLRSDRSHAAPKRPQTKRRGDQLRGEVASLNGRRSSLEALIREHSYSTDTVRNIFKHQRQQAEPQRHCAAVGTLADFLEVDGQYESVVDEFLRDELNYIVVKSWDAADAGMHLLKTDVDGRATFLVHPNDAQANFSFAEGMTSAAQTSTEASKASCR